MCLTFTLAGVVALHAAPKDASQDFQNRVVYGKFPPPLAIFQQLSACYAGTGRGVGELMGFPANVGSADLRCIACLLALALFCMFRGCLLAAMG